MRCEGKVILITGGTGTFGKAFIKRLFETENPKKVIVFSRDEWKQWQMREEGGVFSSEKIRYFLGDVRDANRLMRAFYDVDIVVHAAAIKQVPTAEYNPCECVKTNVLGAMNVIDAAIDSGVGRVVALSTDKAVAPVNLYGATKLCSDKLFLASHAYVGARPGPLFSVVRYGNVLGSRGSALAYWKELVTNGADHLPITDDRMTRFWLTIDRAADFVLDVLECMTGGEVFVPKCPSMRIVDLAQAIAPHLPLKVVGIRPGEKIHEQLFTVDGSTSVFEHDRHYTIAAAGSGKRVSDGFVYSSEANTEWLGAGEIAELARI